MRLLPQGDKLHRMDKDRNKISAQAIPMLKFFATVILCIAGMLTYCLLATVVLHLILPFFP